MTIPLFKPYFGGHLCYYGNGKSWKNARPLHFGYSSKHSIRKKWRKATFSFWLQGGGGGQISPLMHVAQSLFNEAESFKVPMSSNYMKLFELVPEVQKKTVTLISKRFAYA